MHRRTLVLRSLRHRWRSHLGVLLGAAIGSAALIGALVVGDSVRGSLRAQALQRLGWVEVALAPADRFFTADLGRRAGAHVAGTHASTNVGAIAPFARMTTALRLPATAARQDGAARANQTQVLGVQSNFWPARLTEAFAAMPRGSAWINEPLAAQLNAKPGDGIVLRIHKPSALSRDVPITPQADASVALRLTVQRVLGGADLGNFSLHSGQAPPLNAFVRLDDLDLPAGLKDKANLLLAAREDLGKANVDSEGERDWLKRRTLLADYGLHVRAVTNLTIPGAAVEVWTDRIFLDPVVTQSALALASAPDGSSPTNASDASVAASAQGVLTYLVNQLRAGDRLVPYSMVSAAGPPWTPSDLRGDEIVVNEWLAQQLGVKAGDAVELAYFLPESGASLVERTNRFRVRSIVPLAGVHADRTLMPEFPGLSKAESTHDWDAGFPLVHKIGEADEAYWKQHRGTPKAFVSWAAGQAMWTNRFGNATSIRLTATHGGDAVGTMERALRERFTPAEFGLAFEPVRERALAASAQAQDFGELFLSFSFFLIVAALILMALLFQFGLEQRTAEVGTLLALGFTPARVRLLFLTEGVALALLGGMIGVVGGLAYARAMLQGLATIWRDAIGASALQFFVTPLTLAIGLFASVVVCALTIWIVLRKLARRPARELLAEGSGLESADAGGDVRRPGRFAGSVAALTALGGGGLIGWALAGEGRNSPPVFFGAGAMLLIAGVATAAWWLRRWERAETGRLLTLVSLGWRGATRRRTRSLASIALLASGSFLIVAVGANRLDAEKDATRRSSGTGGFALMGESTLPVVRDLNTPAGREFYGLDESAMAGVQVVPLRVRDGDEASCLNLNRAQQPRLFGVKPELLADRSAFTFAAFAQRSGNEGLANPWLGLKTDPGSEPDAIPAVGDAGSIQWALKKKLGDTLDYTDERGQVFKVRLVGAVANSILQGSLVIDEAEFKRRFPGESGHRMFLIDVPSNQPPAKVSAALSRALQDVGFQAAPTARRLAEFNAVQNTYLNTFQVLGGLGLLLGSAGLGVVVLRNVLERRAELGVMQAVGFRRRRLQWLVLGEHGGLLLIGLAVGLVAALVAVLPVLLAPGAELHTRALAITLGGVFLSGGVCTVIATRWALRGRLLDAIRSE